MNEKILKFFADFIEKELGIIYSQQNYFQLEKRINDICKSLEVEDANALHLKALKEGITGHFKSLLLDVATNNETSFYRDPKIWRAVENSLIPMWREAHSQFDKLKIWSAASSFGQEPYSLVMKLLDMKEKDPSFPSFDIMATDVSSEALARAQAGEYSQLEVQRGLPAPLLVKYFEKTPDDRWRISNQVRSLVQYKYANLLDLSPITGGFDVIFCRNVLIYQDDAKKKEILKNITQRLKDGGFLIMGATESLIGLSDAYEQVLAEGVILFRKKGAKAAQPSTNDGEKVANALAKKEKVA